MNKILAAIIITIAFGCAAFAQTASIPLVEEDREFWNDILRDESIKNKNLLYASFVAYKDRLNDLSLETFRESMKNNQGNDIVQCLAQYYIGKNLIALGRLPEGLAQLQTAGSLPCPRVEHLKYAIRINTAIAHHRLRNLREFNRILTEIVNDDSAGRYRSIARGVLTLER